MSTALITQQPTAIIPMSDVQAMAKAVAASGVFPSIKNESQAMTLMLLCQAEGLHPMHAMRRYHIMPTGPAMRAEAMLAEFQRQGGKVRWIERTSERVEAVFSYDGQDSPPIVWDSKRCQTAGLAGGNHAKFPVQMKTARVISEGVRLMNPGVVVGIYTPEEMEDVPENRPEPAQRRPLVNDDKPTTPDEAVAKMTPKAMADLVTGGTDPAIVDAIARRILSNTNPRTEKGDDAVARMFGPHVGRDNSPDVARLIETYGLTADPAQVADALTLLSDIAADGLTAFLEAIVDNAPLAARTIGAVNGAKKRLGVE